MSFLSDPVYSKIASAFLTLCFCVFLFNFIIPKIRSFRKIPSLKKMLENGESFEKIYSSYQNISGKDLYRKDLQKIMVKAFNRKIDELTNLDEANSFYDKYYSFFLYDKEVTEKLKAKAFELCGKETGYKTIKIFYLSHLCGGERVDEIKNKMLHRLAVKLQGMNDIKLIKVFYENEKLESIKKVIVKRIAQLLSQELSQVQDFNSAWTLRHTAIKTQLDEVADKCLVKSFSLASTVKDFSYIAAAMPKWGHQCYKQARLVADFDSLEDLEMLASDFGEISKRGTRVELENFLKGNLQKAKSFKECNSILEKALRYDMQRVATEALEKAKSFV